ncbi:MAG: extracellular solute-binding protein [Alphaproteobacteria bacterium]|nr:extracellular solute-binding protein [Alphaproteobacteria bacterium]
MAKSNLTRRGLVRSGATAAAAGAAAFHVRGAHAAGKLSVGFWDHWVPGANDSLTALCREWAAKEKVDLTIDYITSQGSKNLLTIAAEAQARAGHDILSFPTWHPADHARSLEPVDDVMAELIKKNGAVNRTVEYLGKSGGKWIAVPAAPGSQMKPPCSRIDLMKQHAGIDVQAMYPAGAPPKADAWTWEAFLGAAEKCFKAGVPFGLPLGQTSDAVDWVGALFQSHRAQLVNSNGDIIVKSDAVRQVLEYAKRLVQWLPTDVFSWDDASNNRWIISGRGALIMNPPSSWAVAVRDAPQIGAQLWTHGMPAGPNGRYAPFLPYFWGIWNFSRNKSAAKSLIMALCQPEAIAKLVEGSRGYDLPSFANLTTLKTWGEIEPPKGTLYHYPNPHNHQVQSIAAAPCPPKIANQIYTQATMTKMIARVTTQGESIDKCLDWAQRELQGFKRA